MQLKLRNEDKKEIRGNVKNLIIPEVTDADMAFGVRETNKDLLKIAEEEGHGEGYSKYCNLFSTLFFTGGKLDFKEGLSEEFKTKYVRYLKANMGSFALKHEDKTSICALLLSRIHN